MGLQVNQLCIHLRRHFGNDFGVVSTCGYRKIGTRWAVVHEVTQFWRLLREDQADARSVRRRLAYGGVVHIEDEIGPFRNELCGFEQIEVLWAEAGVEFAESIWSASLLHLETPRRIRFPRD